MFTVIEIYKFGNAVIRSNYIVLSEPKKNAVVWMKIFNIVFLQKKINNEVWSIFQYAAGESRQVREWSLGLNF